MNQDKILTSCEDVKSEDILKAALINAIIRIEKSTSKRERADLRQFIIECAKVLESFRLHDNYQEFLQENMQQQH